MRRAILCATVLGLFPVLAYAGTCERFADKYSTAYDTPQGRITLTWRTDYPGSTVTRAYRWESIRFEDDWRGYAHAVLSDFRDAGLTLHDGRLQLPGNSPWWIAPWMDYTANGRERVNGLTKERNPDAFDLSPTSPSGPQVWAIGWYNTEGAQALGQVFASPCNPALPAIGQPGWEFPDRTVSVKFLFTNAKGLSYLGGSPEALVANRGAKAPERFQLLQVDFSVRDKRASQTGWVMGTFVWKGPPTGDGLFDNLVPVGVMWGNDPGRFDVNWHRTIPAEQSRINPDLAGVLWEGPVSPWPHRPYAGFQGRLNGPADNMRSSCVSCHALAQWPRHKDLRLLPTYPVGPNGPEPALTEGEIISIVGKYFGNTRGGELVDPDVQARPLDYSLQLEAGLTRMCAACRDGALTGPTPSLCRDGVPSVSAQICGSSPFTGFLRKIFTPMPESEKEPPRQ